MGFGLFVGSAANAGAATVTLAWDPNPETNIVGYTVWYGNQSGALGTAIQIGNVTSYTVGNLPPGVYYFAIQARNAGGSSPRSGEVAVVLDPPTTLPPSSDFSGDGRFDLLWQNGADGTISSWFMNGINMTSGVLLTPNRVPDLNWKIVGRGDFNGDGWADLVWQHQTNGTISTWLMNGTTMISGVVLSPGQVSDVNWKIVGIGDFNGDLKPDLVWHHQTQGLLSVWLMNGTTMTNGILLTPNRVTDTNWKVAGVGDMDSDGRPDLVWQHQTNGTVSTWLMNGTTMREGRLLTPSVVTDLNWKIRAVGDINSDGKTDLVWQHGTQGLISTWLMNGTSMTSGTLLNPSQVANTNWKIVGPK
jgi:hypothetical protein